MPMCGTTKRRLSLKLKIYVKSYKLFVICLKIMDKKLFTNNIFKIIFIIIVGLDLYSAVIKISENSATTSISILKYINLIICLFALISFFIITKYSLSILKLYIVYRLIIYPLFVLFIALKFYVFYSVNRFDIDVYFSMLSTLIIGMILYFFFNKYKLIENKSNVE